MGGATRGKGPGFFHYLRNYKKESVLGPLFKLFEALLDLAVPLVVAAMVDTGIRAQDAGYVLRMGVLLVLLGAVGLAFSITAQWFAAKAAVGYATEMRRDLYAHIQRLSFAELDHVGTSTLVTRLTSDVNQVQAGINLMLRLVLRAPFIVFGAVVLSFTIDVAAALVFAVAVPVLFAVVFAVMLASVPLYARVQARLDAVTQDVRENLAGVRVIRAFNRQDEERRAFEADNEQLVRAQLFVGKLSALMNPLTYVVVNLATIALVWVGGREVDGGLLTQGSLIALVNYMAQILVELVKMADLVVTINRGVACQRRVRSILELQPSVVGAPRAARRAPESRPAAPRISFQNVSLTYPGAGAPSLAGISFDVALGETAGVIGGTGSGKTSLANLIPRFYDATGGAVLVDGTDVREQDLADLRRRVGVVPQHALLVSGTVADNLRWGDPDASDDDLRQALACAQALDFVENLSGGLYAPVSQGGRNFSGGQRQRLTIARALVRRPDILILDDASSALDYATDARLRRAIRQLDPRMTVVVVSQRAAAVHDADRILVLDEGALAGLGTHAELLASCETYREICSSQGFGEGGL